jgi:hypothetical protein
MLYQGVDTDATLPRYAFSSPSPYSSPGSGSDESQRDDLDELFGGDTILVDGGHFLDMEKWSPPKNYAFPVYISSPHYALERYYTATYYTATYYTATRYLHCNTLHCNTTLTNIPHTTIPSPFSFSLPLLPLPFPPSLAPSFYFLSSLHFSLFTFVSLRFSVSTFLRFSVSLLLSSASLLSYVFPLSSFLCPLPSSFVSYVLCLCSMPMFYAYVLCLCSMPMFYAYVLCLCFMPMFYMFYAYVLSYSPTILQSTALSCAFLLLCTLSYTPLLLFHYRTPIFTPNK